MDTQSPIICWFRQDLRLGDNPALVAAHRTGRAILPLYVLDDESAEQWAMGGASRWWLHQSLGALDRRLDGALCCLKGRADLLLLKLVRETGATAVYVNRCNEPWRIVRDARIAAALAADGISWHEFHGSTLFDPERVVKADGEPYRVFTPFYRRGCLQQSEPPREPLPRPRSLRLHDHGRGFSVDNLGLMPTIAWYRGMANEWEVGEQGALRRLDRFVESGLPGYKEGRNFPARRHVSRLSPHLHFGEISPNQVWYGALQRSGDIRLEADIESFLSELGWREFSHYLLRHWPTLPERNLQTKFDRFSWATDAHDLAAWQSGRTGYPIIDAGMRELWQTGYMHNRVRMIVGSFLVKNLLLDWRLGQAWFWDTLVDADLANNSASWQWVAGCGADAAPYFRIFNPVTQGQKFDPDGSYVRRFVPELAELAAEVVHRPWSGPASERRALDYPEPIVDLRQSRERALAVFREI